jgi:hypothetical protein
LADQAFVLAVHADTSFYSLMLKILFHQIKLFKVPLVTTNNPR